MNSSPRQMGKLLTIERTAQRRLGCPTNCSPGHAGYPVVEMAGSREQAATAAAGPSLGGTRRGCCATPRRQRPGFGLLGGLRLLRACVLGVPCHVGVSGQDEGPSPPVVQHGGGQGNQGLAWPLLSGQGRRKILRRTRDSHQRSVALRAPVWRTDARQRKGQRKGM